MILSAIPAGLMAGFLAWFAAGGPAAGSTALAPAATELAALRRPRPSLPDLWVSDVTGLAAAPLFTLTTGPGAVPEPVIRLAGLARARGRAAALLAINDKPAEWLSRGESRDGVTLQAVTSSSVVVDTVYGEREVTLGDRPMAEPPPAAPRPPAIDPATRGFRMPPPPASAPRTR